ncbi:MAG: hypothetical protein MK101_11940 [Phycisphaerales bacterium]|nr:hypothetical protein [Phycisphaerales bacterium]
MLRSLAVQWDREETGTAQRPAFCHDLHADAWLDLCGRLMQRVTHPLQRLSAWGRVGFNEAV